MKRWKLVIWTRTCEASGEAVVHDRLYGWFMEGADELTLRAEGALRTLIDTTSEGDKSWEPPLVDEDWHVICQAIFQGVEG